MLSEVCSCLWKYVTYYIRKILLWSLQRTVKMTHRQLLASGVVLMVIVYLWLRNGDNHYSPEEPSNNPVILWWTEGFPGTSTTKYCSNSIKCDVFSVNNISNNLNIHAYLFYGSNIKFNELPLPRKPKDIIWGLYHEESPRNSEELLHEPILKMFNYSATFSRHSDVPFPLQHLDSFDDINSLQYFVYTNKKNEHLKEIAPVLYLQSDCETSTERDVYVRELMNITKVDSYGACLNNKQLPEQFTRDYLNNLNEDEFLKFVARYKFVIAIENGVCDDYVTEKFWRAIKVGSVPIYFGCSLIRDWLPNEKSAILLEDFPTPTILNDHINKLLGNDALYEEYLEHKLEQIVTNSRLAEEYRKRSYQTDSLQTVEKFECFVCNKIYDKMNGKADSSVVSKSHYNCPKPLSALQLAVNPHNSWVHSWEYKRDKAVEIYKNVMNNV